MPSSELEITTGLPSAAVTLLDHGGEVVASSSGRLEARRLSPGLYRVQVEAGATMAEELITVRPGAKVHHHVTVVLPLVTPVTGVATNHRLHAAPASDLSVTARVRHGAGSRIVLFTRVTEEIGSGTEVAVDLNGLDLLDLAGDSVTGAPTGWVHGSGFVGISVEVDPGTYLLRSTGIDQRVSHQSVVALADWTTLMFLPAITVDPGRQIPVAALAVAHLVALDRRFEPYDHGSDAAFCAEMAIEGLRDGEVAMPERGWQMLTRTELSADPMLGMYLAHALMARRQPPLARVRRLIGDLRALLPGHPDADALWLAYKSLTANDTRTRVAPRTAPPMLRASYQALIARDSIEPQVLVDDSLAEAVSTRQRPDSLWARWDPDATPDIVDVELSGVEDAAVAIAGIVDTAQVRGRSATRTGGQGAANPLGPFVGNAIIIPSQRKGKVTREVAQLADAVKRIADNRDADDTSVISVAELSRHVGLPLAKVRANLEAISDASELDLY